MLRIGWSIAARVQGAIASRMRLAIGPTTRSASCAEACLDVCCCGPTVDGHRTGEHVGSASARAEACSDVRAPLRAGRGCGWRGGSVIASQYNGLRM